MKRGVLSIALLAACTDGAGAPSEIADVDVARPATLRGSCDGARPLGELASYRHVIELGGDAPRVRVRADPSWPAEDHGNVLGELVSPQRIAAFGPVKGIPSAGIGWVVPLRDDDGRTCRGYVSATVAEAVACDRSAEPGIAFPEPLDVVPGPCVVR